MRQVGSLPWEVVVVQHGRPSRAHGGGQGGRRGIERERAQILDDDEIGRGQRLVQLPAGGGRRSVDSQALEEDIDRAGAGHGEQVPAQLAERVGPFRRLDRDAVTAPETERKEGGGRHAGAL